MVPPGTAKRRVLVVEDDSILGDLVAETLGESGYTVVGPIPDAQKSFDVIEEEEISVAILDIKLRDGTSYPVADRLISEDIPFVFYTGQSPQNIPDAYREHQVVSKSASPRKLLSALDAVL